MKYDEDTDEEDIDLCQTKCVGEGSSFMVYREEPEDGNLCRCFKSCNLVSKFVDCSGDIYSRGKC